MKTEEKNKKHKERNLDEIAITLEVSSDVIEKVRIGEITHLLLDINEQNQSLILENVDGNLILVIDEMPTTFHGCYLYNEGEFPYAIKNSLQFLVLINGHESCLTRIIGVQTKPTTRFHYEGAGKPIIEDPSGDSCVWEVAFEVVPVLHEAKKYLMRWNPSISSFTEEDLKECIGNKERGVFRLNWSIFEWEEARRGDVFYMLRVGDEKAGIVFSGLFTSDPYPADDWAGSTKRRMYVDMVCLNAADAADKTLIPIDKLTEAIPSFEWSKGHSGVLLPNEVAAKLPELFDKE